MKDFQRILRIREILGYSQRELAEEFQVSHAAVGLWEAGKRKIPGPVLKLMDLYEKQLGLVEEDAEKDPFAAIQSSWLQRSLAATGLGTQMTARLFLLGLSKLFRSGDEKNSIRAQAYQALGKKTVTTLSRLKGLPHKLGQLLSYMDMEIPDDVREYFRTLQSQTPSLPHAQIVDVFLKDFKKLPKQLFETWEPKAFAAASMGQVHKATSHSGDALAVKVQYPGLKKIIEVDLSQAKILESIAGIVLRGYKPGPVLQELRARFLEECDYRIEAKNLKTFAKMFEDDAKVHISKVYEAFSSEHVLTTEFLNGQTYNEFLQTASQEEKNAAAHTIWKFVWTSLLKFGRFSADPHPGNYIFMSDGEVGFLDFGCVKEIPKNEFENWKAFLLAVKNKNQKALFESLQALNVFEDSSKIDQTHFANLMSAWYEPAFSKQPFHFTRSFLQNHWSKLTTNNPNLAHMQFPPEIAFLNQVQWGLYSLLADLNVSGVWDVSDFFDKL